VAAVILVGSELLDQGTMAPAWRGQRNPSGLAQLVVRRWAAPIDASGGVVES